MQSRLLTGSKYQFLFILLASRQTQNSVKLKITAIAAISWVYWLQVDKIGKKKKICKHVKEKHNPLKDCFQPIYDLSLLSHFFLIKSSEVCLILIYYQSNSGCEKLPCGETNWLSWKPLGPSGELLTLLWAPGSLGLSAESL